MSEPGPSSRPVVRRTYGKRSQPPSRPVASTFGASPPRGLAPRPIGYEELESLSPLSSPSGLGNLPFLDRSIGTDEDSATSGVPSSPISVLQDLLGGGNMIARSDAVLHDQNCVVREGKMKKASSMAAKGIQGTSAAVKHKQISLNSFFHRQAGPASAAASSSRTATRNAGSHSQSAHPGTSSSASTSTSPAPQSRPPPSKSLTQLHLLPIRLATTPSSSSTFHPSTVSSRYITCSTCQMTYLPSGLGGEDDRIHARHCERVKEGVAWTTSGMDGIGNEAGQRGSRDQERSRDPGIVVERDVRVGRREKGGCGSEISGSVVCVDGRAAVAGNSKLLDILSSVDTVLSAPSLPDDILKECKIFLFVTSSQPSAAPISTIARSALSSFSGASESVSSSKIADGEEAEPSARPSKRLKPEVFKALADAARARERGAHKSTVSGIRKVAKVGKERVVGVLVVQPIKWAMRVLTEEEKRDLGTPDGADGVMDAKPEKSVASMSGFDEEDEARSDNGATMARGKRKRSSDEMVVACDPETGNGTGGAEVGAVICDPERLPTKLGVHRIFTIPTYRGLRISKVLLNAACAHAIHGRKCDPFRGEVAFSQPTSSGRAVMDAWGKGHVRVFVEDEQE